MKTDLATKAENCAQKYQTEIHSLLTGEQLSPPIFNGLPILTYLGRADRARTLEITSDDYPAFPGVEPDQKVFQLAPLIHPEDRDSVLEMINSAVASNQSFALEYRLSHAGEEWRTVWEQGRPVPHGAPGTIQGYLVDVTQRSRREQARLDTEHELLQTQKFNALNQLAAGVAHEFNNLIAGILGSAELLALDIPAKHPGHETLRQIFEASNHARDFVHKLRALGQRQAPIRQRIQLQSVVEECLQILRTIIPAKVELQTQLNPDCPPINADHGQIQQAILDLCLQAWQGLADRRGRIKIILENSPPARPPTGASSRLRSRPHVCLTVQDSSPGLEKDACEDVFNPFRHRRGGGKKTGLELFLVRETIQAHQGEIFVESKPGHGLAFHLWLPVAEEK